MLKNSKTSHNSIHKISIIGELKLSWFDKSMSNLRLVTLYDMLS